MIGKSDCFQVIYVGVNINIVSKDDNFHNVVVRVTRSIDILTSASRSTLNTSP